MNRADLEALDRATLADLVLRQAERLAELEARLAEMERRFEELERRASRGAAPFARPESKRSPSPKRPGRKGGHVGACRIRPPESKRPGSATFGEATASTCIWRWRSMTASWLRPSPPIAAPSTSTSGMLFKLPSLRRQMRLRPQ